MDEIFVERTPIDAGNEAFPDPRISSRMKPIAFLVPIVETAGHKNSLGVWRPDGEIGSFDSFADHTRERRVYCKPANDYLG